MEIGKGEREIKQEETLHQADNSSTSMRRQLCRATWPLARSPGGTSVQAMSHSHTRSLSLLTLKTGRGLERLEECF